MDYNIVIVDILNEIFNKEEQISKTKYISFYSKVYYSVNNLEITEYKSFESCITKFLQSLMKTIYINIKTNIQLYFEYYDYYLEKALLSDKIFMYYQNEKNDNKAQENGFISGIYYNVWDEHILTNFYPFILEDIKNIKELELDKNIFEKIEKYSLHINTLNKELNNTFKYQIFDTINLQKEISIDKILEIINYYDKILKIFDEDTTIEILKNNIKALINENEKTLFINIEKSFFEIKLSLETKEIDSYCIYSDLNKLTNYFDNYFYDKYDKILFSVLKIEKYDNIETLIKNINITDFMLKKLSPKNYYKNIYENKLYSENFIERTLENISENFDNNFNMELVKYINKNMNNIQLFKNINIIINSMKNKETFTVYYKKALKTRLLNSNVSNLNNESYLINILIQNNDLIDVSRLLVMLKDYQSSIIYSSEFNKLFNNNAFVNLTTYDMWGITPNEYDTNNFSKRFRNEIETMKNNFKTYYLINNEDRNVNFVDDISTCFIDFNGVELECNYLQANLLYQLDDNEYIVMNKNMDKMLVNSLLKPKLLIKKDGKLFVNERFQYSKPSLKLYKLYRKNDIKKSVKKEMQGLVFKKQEYLDAFIMRSLKKNKESYINCKELYKDATEHLKDKFKIEKELFDNRISHLQNNGYLELSDNSVKYQI